MQEFISICKTPRHSISWLIGTIIAYVFYKVVGSIKEKQRILVVEDDEIMQRALAFSLERAGFEVTSVSTVKETMTALDSELFSIVITDIFLPDGDGLKVLSLVHDRQPNVPVLAMTGYGHTELGKKAKQVFGEQLFEKPFKKMVLIGKVSALMENVG